MNDGFAEMVRQVLADTSSLPPEFLDYMVQHGAQNPIPVQSLNAPTVIASGVGSTANAPTRYVGGTTSGAPTTGTYVAGDFVVSHDGHMYVCTVAGTPGTWTTWLAQGDLTYANVGVTVNVTSTSSASPTTIVGGTAATYTASPIYIEIYAGEVVTPNSAAGDKVTLLLREDGANIGTIGIIATPAAATMSVPFYAQIKRTPSAGSHTYGLSAFANTTTGTPFVASSTGGGTNFVPTFVRTRYA